ncbi:MAG: efflux RND transporter periplasmic adaptor subunit [Hymenobacter sp.]
MALALAGCHDKTPAAAEAKAAPATPVDPDQLTLNAAQYRAAGIEVGSFERKNLTTDVQANGVVDVPPQNMASVSAVLGGYVVHVLVLPGQHVAKGATVAVLRHPDYLKLQQDYLQSRARTTFLTQDLARQRILDVEDVGAKRKLQQAAADYATERAAQQSLAAQLRQLGLSPEHLAATGTIVPTVALTAPIGGYVKVVNINPGQFVNPQDVLVELVDRSDLHLQLKVFEKDIAQVKVGQLIRFRVPGQGAAAPEHTAHVFLVGKAFDDQAHTVAVHAHLDPGAENLLPGQFVAAHIQTGSQRQRTLPEAAVIEAGELSYVFVRLRQTTSGSSFRRLRVRTGPHENGDVAVTLLDPAADTTLLVRRGAYFLNAELSKGAGGGDE